MQPIAKIQNKSVPWTDKLRPRVTDTVVKDGVFYSNIAGYNDVVTNTNVWQPFATASAGTLKPVEIDLTAANIAGADPFWTTDLSQKGLPAFPIKIAMYKDIDGSGNWQNIEPIAYNATTKILSQLDSPVDFPNQKIKLFVI